MACENIKQIIDTKGYITTDEYAIIWYAEMRGREVNPPPGYDLPVLTPDICNPQATNIYEDEIYKYDVKLADYLFSLSIVCRMLAALPTDMD